MNMAAMYPLPPKVETIAQFKLALMDFPNTVFFFYHSDVMTLFQLNEEIKPLLNYAHIEKGYNCAYYDCKQANLHKGKILENVAIGIMFYHQMECRAVNTTFDVELFKKTMDTLPTLDEISVARAKAKAKADAAAAAAAAAAAKGAKEARLREQQKNYNFSLCTIL